MSYIWSDGRVLVAGVLLSVFLLLHRAFLTPVTRVRGPLIARFTDLWYVYRIYKGNFETDNLRLHQKYGSIVRYGPNRFSLCSEDAFRKIYPLGGDFAKSSWYNTWSSPHQWNLFADRDRKRHAANRRQYQSTYSMSSLVNYEAFVDECSRIFFQRLREKISSNQQSIDMGHWFQCFAFDVIGMITYSKRLGFLDAGEDIAGVMSNLEDHLAYATLAGVYSWLHPLLFKVRNWMAGNTGTGRQYIINFTRERMDEHHRAEKKASVGGGAGEEEDVHGGTVDFLAKFFQKHDRSEEAFTEYHILAGCVSNMVAGSDTTAISLSAILYFLLRTPTAMEKLREEVDDHSRNDEDHITFQQSQQMPYLQAVIKEALRLHPATGLPLERVVPKGGITIDGQYFPAGSLVGINAWVKHRDTSVFGDDADEFRPDRWLVADPETLREMNRYWMPFGLASRTCIGRHISTLEMSKLIPRLVRDFEMRLCRDESWKTVNRWFVKPQGFEIILNSRSSKD